MNVLIRAPLLSISGYGVHSRQIFSFLDETSVADIKKETQVVNWGHTTWLINPDLENGIVGKIMESTSRSEAINDISFQVQLPDEWDPNLARKNVGVSAVVETDRCNPEWINACNRMDAIIVPSEHAKLCLHRSGDVKTKIYVIPEWYHVEIEKPLTSENHFENMEFESKFNFLAISQINGHNSETDRKNIFNTIKWFCEAFKDNKDVGLVLKTNSGRGTRIDRKITKNILSQVLKEVRPGQFPRVHFIHGNLTNDEVCGLYRNKSIKCLINLTRGEGFGLPILEAAASDLPVMVTNWSAHMEFLSLGKSINIDYDLVNISNDKVDKRIFVSGAKWANPSESDFKKKIHKFYNKPQIPKVWACNLGKKIRCEFNKASIIKKYEEVLLEIME
ncbi:hypothetical protein CL614_06695 [archaeon]|jgi:glycosyltransferase involved in cell wall biosynthesis|nr:hypothetical protein [archaeon]